MVSLIVAFLCLTSAAGLIMPMTKPDGSLDVSSLLSHIALLEQTIESKASTSEITDLKSQLQTALADSKQTQLDLKETQTELKTTQVQLLTAQNGLSTAQADIAHAQTDLVHAQTEIVQLTKTQDETKADLKSTQIKVALLESQLNSVNYQCSCNTTTPVTESSKDIPSLKADISTLKTDVFHLQSQRNASQLAGGAQFTRWGRTTCPIDTKVVYKGYTGGTHYKYRASSATILCLPEHPIYAVHTSPHSTWESYIFGTEYETSYSGNPFKSLNDDDMPCVVCESETKRSAIMVPARNQCYPGWTLEYWGYLMGGEISQSSSEYICVDKDPESIPGGQTNDNQHLLYIVSSVCGSLPCLPYEDKWQLTCAVCSK